MSTHEHVGEGLGVQLGAAFKLFLLLSLVTGLAYPLLVTAIGQLLFPAAANGSLIYSTGQAQATLQGSALIGQSFVDPGHFWSRPSATAPQANNGLASGGSNLGPANPALVDAVKARVAALRAADPDNHQAIPADLVTASASGLDPHLSPAAVYYQLPRVARNRGIPEAQLLALVETLVEGRQWGVLGEARVNVLRLNLGVDRLASAGGAMPSAAMRP